MEGVEDMEVEIWRVQAGFGGDMEVEILKVQAGCDGERLC
jgi:hypothetical protein